MSELGMRVGENIRIYRRANRMTLSELAERINKSKATVGKYEQGAIALDMDTLYEIAAALGVSPFQLTFTTAGPAASSEASWSPGRTRGTTP